MEQIQNFKWTFDHKNYITEDGIFKVGYLNSHMYNNEVLTIRKS